MRARDYQPGDQISRHTAAQDLLEDFSRFKTERWDHIATDMLVNLWRIAGISDRDWSQRLGRATAVVLAFWAVASFVKLWM